ncbi:MAG TPA: hypothetical protein PKG48_03705 [Bacteroidales bacterium]|nr:hypothetical protein [Bacteroidales bacterium]HPS63054.1 hypothetical protein [Bacteroidales bacterium]
MFSNILDILRLAATGAAFFFGYRIGFAGDSYHPEAQLHFMIPLLITVISGISGLEGLLAGDRAARAKGYETGSNYQRQSAFAMITLALVAVGVWLLNWGIQADLTIFFTFLIFHLLSGINHAVDAVKRKNYSWQNINRPFLVLFLMAGMIYPVLMALKNL